MNRLPAISQNSSVPSGSRVRGAIGDRCFVIHTPHPRRELAANTVKDLRDFFEAALPDLEELLGQAGAR